MEQFGFSFDATLEHIPVSQFPPPPVIPASIPTEAEAFVQAALVLLETIPDGFDTEDVLEVMGVPKLSRVGWHRSRVLEAIKRPTDNPYGGSPYGDFQGYMDGNNIRYRRLPPYEPCRGYEGKECATVTRGGALCAKCRELEAEANCLSDPYVVFSSKIYLDIGSLIPTDSGWRVISTASPSDIPDSVDYPSARYWYRAVPHQEAEDEFNQP